MANGTETGYALVNGLELYYEIRGTGQPLILLHGGIAASEVFGESIDVFASTRKVVIVHLQGHGKTRDIDRPLRYESMADDVAGLIDHLELVRPDVLGYSMGAGVAIQIAIRHPEKLGKLIVVSIAMRRDGNYPEVIVAFDSMAAMAPQFASGIAQSPLAELHPLVDWESLFIKMAEMENSSIDWSADVPKITAPTLLMFADADSLHLEHIVEFYKLLGGGQGDPGMDGTQRSGNRLAIVPGASHYDLLSKPHVATLAIEFLDS